MKYPMIKITFVLLAVLSAAACSLADGHRYMPTGDIYQGGRVYIDENNVKGYLDFAVFTKDHFETVYGMSSPGEGVYVYAYQVVCDEGTSDAVEFFSITGVGTHTGDADDPIGIGSDSIDTSNEVAPDSSAFTPQNGNLYANATWQFDDGALVDGQRSYMMLISSNHSPVTTGGYSFEAPVNGEIPLPNPEPASLALLSIGAMLLRKRKTA